MGLRVTLVLRVVTSEVGTCSRWYGTVQLSYLHGLMKRTAWNFMTGFRTDGKGQICMPATVDFADSRLCQAHERQQQQHSGRQRGRRGGWCGAHNLSADVVC